MDGIVIVFEFSILLYHNFRYEEHEDIVEYNLAIYVAMCLLSLYYKMNKRDLESDLAKGNVSMYCPCIVMF